MEEYLYIAFCVGISSFIFKMIVNKINKETDKNKEVMKDSVYIFFLTFLVIYIYSFYFKEGTGKTKVFTNDPGF